MRILKIALLLCTFIPLGLQTANAADPIHFFSKSGKIDNNLWYISNGWANGDIQSCEWRKTAVSADEDNLKLTLSKKGGKIRPYGCGEIHTNALSGYGLYTANLTAAAGSGLNTAFFTYIGPPAGGKQHDEIDFEFLGKNPQSVQVNYYVNGKSTGAKTIDLGFDASKEFHTYAFLWSKDIIVWFVDGKPIHQTKNGDALPTTPGRIYLSLWSGSKSVNDWLGPFNYKKPVSAEYAWVKYTAINPSNGAEK